MLNYKDKPIEELDFNECLEFEKELLKKVLGASKSGMSGGIIDQLNTYLGIVRIYKAEALQKEIDGLVDSSRNTNDGATIDTGLDEE